MFSSTRRASGSDVKHTAQRLVLSDDVNNENAVKLKQIVGEHAMVIFSKKECCMAYATKALLLKIGANPLLLEVDDAELLRRELSKIVIVGDIHEGLPFPLVFVGGELVGGTEWIIAMHMSGELVPLLKESGALWL